MSEPTLYDTLGEFDAGIFVNKVTEALKMVALGTVNNGKKGTVTLSFELDQIGDSDSVQVKHTLKYSKPTKRGKQSEEDTTLTPMYVNNFGYLTISPQIQEDIFKAENAENVTQFRSAK